MFHIAVYGSRLVPEVSFQKYLFLTTNFNRGEALSALRA
jgi:hypothetical protein